MNVFFPFHTGDWVSAVEWLRWTAELGGCSDHALFLHPAKNTKADSVDGLASTARNSWREVFVIKDYEGATGWPAGPNACMRQAAQFFYIRGERGKPEPWAFVETDAIPLSASWLNRLEQEYREGKRPFMGARVEPVGDTPIHMSGVGIYPWDAMSYASGLTIPSLSDTGTELAFDIAAAEHILPKMKATRLIQHVLATPDGKNPTFPTVEELAIIHPEAVIFHRCKDGTLIDRLRSSSSLVNRAQGEPATRSWGSAHATHERTPATVSIAAKTVPDSIAGQLRSLCQAADKIIGGNAGRKQAFHTELRRAKLLGKASSRK